MDTASTDDLRKTIGTRIAAMRVSGNIAPKLFADYLGIKTNLLTRIERGQSAISAELLVRAASFFGVTSAVLTGEELYSDFQAKRSGGRRR